MGDNYIYCCVHLIRELKKHAASESQFALLLLGIALSPFGLPEFKWQMHAL